MLKFILLVIVFFLATRMIVRVVKSGLNFLNAGSSKRSGSSPASFSSGQHVEEADYEVIESHLNDKERNVG